MMKMGHEHVFTRLRTWSAGQLGALALAAAVVPTTACAVPTVNWTAWNDPTHPFTNSSPAFDYNTAATGSLTLPDSTGVNLTLSGEVIDTSCYGDAQTAAGCPSSTYWTSTFGGWGGPAVGTFTSANVPNLPSNWDTIAQTGFTDTVHTLTFSQPVSDIVMNIWSLGQVGGASAYQFDQDFVILSQTPDCDLNVSNANCLIKSGNTLTGYEGHGTVQFTGTFTQISWTVTVPEYFSGFTVGVSSLGSQSIDFTGPADQPYSSAPLTLSASSSSGLSVSFSSQTPSVCTVSGDQLTLLDVGTCTLDADQGGNSNYAAAQTVTQSFDISQASQSISGFNPPTSASVGGTATLSATATSGGTVSFGSASTEVCTVNGDTVSFLDVGTCTVTANQAGTSLYSAAPEATRDITVSASAVPTLGAFALVLLGGLLGLIGARRREHR